MKTLIVDRIESNLAVCEVDENNFVNIPLSAMPSGVKEGDVVKITIDNSQTEKRKQNIDKLMNSLFKD